MEIIRKTIRVCPLCEKKVGFFDKSTSIDTCYEGYVKDIKVKIVTSTKHHKDCLEKAATEQSQKKAVKIVNNPTGGTLPKGYISAKSKVSDFDMQYDRSY